MARSETIIVGGGLGTSGTLRAGGILVIADDDPPTAAIASASLAFARTTHIILSDGVTLSSGSGSFTEGCMVGGNGAEISQTGASTALGSVVLGNGAIARATAGQCINTVVIGHDATAISTTLSSGLVQIGGQSSYTGVGTAVLIGANATSATQSGVCIGHGAAMGSSSSSSNSVSVGCSSQVNGQRNTVVGDGASVTGGGADNVVLGQGATCGAGLRNIVIKGSNTTFNDSIGLYATIFASNQFVVGNDINSVVVGKGNTSATPSTVTFRLTNGVGTNIAAGNYVIQAGLSTGNATPGDIRLTVGVVGGSGATLQTAREGVVVRYSGTAADTYLMVWDVDNATLERVSVGAADSGGAGFKVLRIPN